MNYRTIIISTFLLSVSSSALYAENNRYSLAAQELESHKWKMFATQMSPEEYRYTYQKNQRHVRKFLKSYSKDTLTSMGVPEKGINLMGAAAGLAVTHDAKFYLNKSDTMALEFKDVDSDDRALFLGIKIDW